MAQEFFRVPDLIEKKIVTDYERKHNKKEKHAGIRITVGLTLAIAFLIYYCVQIIQQFLSFFFPKINFPL